MLKNSEYEQLIKPVMIMNKLVTIWPPEKDNNNFFEVGFRLIHKVLVVLIATIMATAITADFIHHIDNVEEATECALLAATYYLIILRLTMYTIHQDKLLCIVQTMKNDWAESNTEDQEILKDKCLYVFTLSKYFIVAVIASGAIFMFGPILQAIILDINDRKLPFRGYFYQNQTNYPAYEFLYIFSIISGSVGTGAIAGATSLNFIITIHGSAKFTIVRKKLETLRNNDNNNDGGMTNFIECAKQHQNALIFAEHVEDTINILALGQFIISTGLLCFSGIQLISGHQDHSTMVKYTSFLNTAIFELFLFSYSGDQLISESEAIGISSYSSHWINADFSKVIRIIMVRSLTPSRITAGKFYDMSLVSFSSVLSSAFSYFTVLRSTHKE